MKNTRWSLKYNNCISCNTKNIPYHAKGLCKKCYAVAFDRTLKRRNYNKDYNKKRYSIKGKVEAKALQRDNRLKLKNSDHIGILGEAIALKTLPGSKWMGENIDIDWENRLVEVKTSLPHLGTTTVKGGYVVQRRTPRWIFNLKNQKGKTDYFLLICLNSDKTMRRMFIIPDNKTDATMFYISEKQIDSFSKYLLS